MKKITLFVIVVLSIITPSCKKAYKCSCTTTLTQFGYYPYQTVSVEAIDKKTTKKTATDICKNTAKQVEANTSLLFDEDVTVKTTCNVL